VQPLRAKNQPKGATALTADQLRRLLTDVSASQRCREIDLVDPITVLAATGLRESELLGLRWVEFDADAGTLTVTGKLVRATGYGLTRVDETKSAAGKRMLPLPRFAVDALRARRGAAVPR
jgi:integrase